MKRIFVAIKIGEQLQREILKWESENLSLRQAQGTNFRFLAGKNLHITLVPPLDFARDLRPSDVEEIIEKLKVAKFEPFEIKFNKISFGPNAREPRLIWAGGRPGKTINDLRLTIYRALGQRPENREFRMHVTLARLKGNNNNYNNNYNFSETVEWRQKVNSFVLMESHLSPAGADYEVLEEFFSLDA